MVSNDPHSSFPLRFPSFLNVVFQISERALSGFLFLFSLKFSQCQTIMLAALKLLSLDLLAFGLDI